MDKPLRVLIIEDSEDDALLLLRQLKKDGYIPAYERVDSAEGLQAALKKQNWELVISDYVLPRFSALEALRFLQDHDYDIPCIIMSGRITDETAVAAMKAGARDYVMKDNLKRIGSAIERELAEAEVRRARRKTENELARAQLELRAMAHRVVESQEEERRNIARELHDEIGQSLTGLKLMMSQATRSSPDACLLLLKMPSQWLPNCILNCRKCPEASSRYVDDLGLTCVMAFWRYTQTRIKLIFNIMICGGISARK
jgi:CheY-like chemotaxis protein